MTLPDHRFRAADWRQRDGGAGDVELLHQDLPPAVIAASPAPGAIAVTPLTTVTVTFSESIQPKTLSFVLKNSSGSTVAAKVTYNDATRTPPSLPTRPSHRPRPTRPPWRGKGPGGQEDGRPVTWSFTTVVPWFQTTLTDFSSGTQSGTTATNTGGGEVQLASPVFEDFNTGTALPTGWTSLPSAPAGGPTSVGVSGGVLSVAGAKVVSNQTFTNAPVEGRVQFGAAANQSFGATNDAGTAFAVFTTKGTTNTLYAQVGANGSILEATIGSLPSGFHVYRIVPFASGVIFYVDGVLRATVAATLPAGTPLKAPPRKLPWRSIPIAIRYAPRGPASTYARALLPRSGPRRKGTIEFPHASSA